MFHGIIRGCFEITQEIHPERQARLCLLFCQKEATAAKFATNPQIHVVTVC